MYAPLEEQPKQSLTREEMTEVGAWSQQSSDAVHHRTRNHLYISISTAGENHLWPLLRPGVHQSVHWVSFSGRPKGQRQIQPTQVLFVQGETCWSRCANAENASSRGEKKNLCPPPSRDCSEISPTPLFLCCNLTWSALWPTRMRASNVVYPRSSPGWLEDASIGTT